MFLLLLFADQIKKGCTYCKFFESDIRIAKNAVDTVVIETKMCYISTAITSESRYEKTVN